MGQRSAQASSCRPNTYGSRINTHLALTNDWLLAVYATFLMFDCRSQLWKHIIMHLKGKLKRVSSQSSSHEVTGGSRCPITQLKIVLDTERILLCCKWQNSQKTAKYRSKGHQKVDKVSTISKIN